MMEPAATDSSTAVSYTHLDVYKRQMEDSEVEWLRNLLSADTVIMRFEGTDYSKFDYTWTEQDRHR